MANGIDILKNMFGLNTKKVNNQNTVVMTQPVKDDKGRIIKNEPIKTDSRLDLLLREFLNNSSITTQTIMDRIERYKQLKFAVYNEPIISTGVKLIRDEVVNSDVQEKALKINAESKLTDYLYSFFEEMNIDDAFIANASENLVIYGDSFSVNDIIDNDILDVYPVDVFSIQDRIEFDPINIKKELNRNMGYISNTNYKRLELLSSMLDKKSMVSRLFKKVLFGFQIDTDLILPPWSVNHLRLFTIESEFYPFGRSIVLNVLSTFYEYRNAMELLQLAKAGAFPIELFNVKVSDNMTPDQYWEVINSAKQQYNNQSFYEQGKEDKSLSKQIWLPGNHIEFDLKNVDIDFENIADLELLEKKMASGMLIPPDIIMSGADKTGEWGVSGKAISKQYKPLAREVYIIQTAILKELTQLARMKLALTGDFDYTEEFRLELSFPNIEDVSDSIDMKNDLLNLSKDIIDNIAELVGVDSNQVPIDVVKDILQKYSFMDKKDIDEWIDKIEKNKGSEDNNEVDLGLGTSKRFKGSKIKSKEILNNLKEEEIQDIIYSNKQKYGNLKEGVYKGRHYYSSLNMNYDQTVLLEILNYTSPGRTRRIY